jgi:ribulose-phosphate 3-epimerase
MIMKLSASMMCADYLHLSEDIRQLEEAQIDYFHIDVMDGDFVPNFQLGTDYVRALRKSSKLPLDIHLMVNNPEKHIDNFELQPGDLMSVHYDTTRHLQRTLALIKERGATPAIALNPSTPIHMFDYVLDDLGMVLIMTVNPGYAGQKLIPQTLKKISDTRQYLNNRGYDRIKIEVDGNCSFENVPKMAAGGAEIFVVGTSSLFHKDYSIKEAAEILWLNNISKSEKIK